MHWSRLLTLLVKALPEVVLHLYSIRASAIFDNDPQYPFHAFPFKQLAAVDYGDCVFDYGRPWEVHACIHAQAADILASGAHLFTLGGDHSITYALLKAHGHDGAPISACRQSAG